jgi:DNA-binding SARP family transcriptional activator
MAQHGKKASITLFGCAQAYADGLTPIVFPTRRCHQLLAFLALRQGRRVEREEIAACLWPESDMKSSRHRLDTEVWRLRASVRLAGGRDRDWIMACESTLSLPDTELIDVDAANFSQFVRSMNSSREPDAAQACRAAIALYGGDLCAGDNSEWLIAPRERLRALYLDCLERELAEQISVKNWKSVAAVCRQLLAEDSLLEHVHRALMSALFSLGNRAGALAHYRSVERLLLKELGVQPMRETRALYASFQADPAEGQLSLPTDAFEWRNPAEVKLDSVTAGPAARNLSLRLQNLARELSCIAKDVARH